MDYPTNYPMSSFEFERDHSCGGFWVTLSDEYVSVINSRHSLYPPIIKEHFVSDRELDALNKLIRD